MTLLEIVNKVLYNNDLNTLSTLDPSLRLKEDLDMDSITIAELTVRVEDEFNIDVFENGMISTLGQIMSKVDKA
jgi:acyl carrier protein